MSLETLTAPLEIKLAGSTDTGEFEGYGAFFGNVDAHGDAISPGAFAATLAARKAQGRAPVPMHFNHGLAAYGGESAVGVWREMTEDAKGLRVRGRISGMNTDRGRYYFERLKDGAISGLSGEEEPDLMKARRLATAAAAELQGVLDHHLSELKGLIR